MARTLDTNTLDAYARQFAAWWLQGYQTGRPDRERDWLKQEFFNFTFKDEFEYLLVKVKEHLAGEALTTFDAAADDLLMNHPRSDDTFHRLLAEKLGIDPGGMEE